MPSHPPTPAKVYPPPSPGGGGGGGGRSRREGARRDRRQGSCGSWGRIGRLQLSVQRGAALGRREEWAGGGCLAGRRGLGIRVGQG